MIIIAAAKVGGINANSNYPVDFILKNLNIQNNLIRSAHLLNIDKLIFLGSSCIYPVNSEQPIKESYLLTSKLEPTNKPYALAKIAGIELCSAYNRQYNRKYIALMPTNMYGMNDSYHTQDSHVIPAMILKIHNALINKDKYVTLWGTGTVKREFLFSLDFARCIKMFVDRSDEIFDQIRSFQHGPYLNVGSGDEISITELSAKIKFHLGYTGQIIFDDTYPDGPARKIVDSSLINSFGWESEYTLDDGLKLTIDDFKNRNLK